MRRITLAIAATLLAVAAYAQPVVVDKPVVSAPVAAIVTAKPVKCYKDKQGNITSTNLKPAKGLKKVSCKPKA